MLLATLAVPLGSVAAPHTNPVLEAGLDVSMDSALPPDSFHLAVAPHLALARQAVRRGEWPLWNDRAGAGYPLLGTADGQLFHPFTLLLYPLPPVAWLPLLAWMRVAVGLALATGLLRRLGAAPVAALTGGALYGAAVAFLAAHPLGTYAALAPGMLLAVTSLRAGAPGTVPTTAGATVPAKALPAAGLFLACVALFAAGDPVDIGLALATSLAFLITSAVSLPHHLRRSLASRFAAVAALAALVTAPVLLLTFRWHPWSYASGRFGASRLRLLRDPFELKWGLGLTSTPLDLDFLRGPQPAWTLGLGLALASLALAAWWLRRRGSAGEAEEVDGLAHSGFFTGLGVAAWLEVARPPGISSLLEYYRLPPAAELTQAAGLPWLLLSITVLGACLIPRLPGRTLGSWAEWRTRWVAAVLGALLALIPVLQNPPPRLDLELISRLQDLQAETGYSRLAALGSLLPAESLASHGLTDIRGHLPHLPSGYVDLLTPLLTAPIAEPRAVRVRESASLAALNHPLYRLLGVRWLVTPPEPPGGHAPGRAAVRLSEFTVWELGGALPILFLPQQVRDRRAPQGWVRWVRQNRDFQRRTLAQPPPEDSARRFSRDAPTATAAADPGAPNAAALRLGAVSATRLEATVETGRRRLMASSLYQDGGWRALVAPARASAPIDDPQGDADTHLETPWRRIPTVLANGPLVGMWLPAGNHRLCLLYRPRGLTLALAASAAGLALAVCWLLPAPRRRRVVQARGTAS